MAVEIKLAPDEKLELVRAQITDATLNSNYFNVTELSDTFSGGKNAFLIAGSELLEPNTEVKVQIRDSVGKVLYCEFSDGSPDEYYEGISKVVAVYVYPTETAFGPATITLVGQTKDTLEIVKWQRTINIDPSLPNTTRVRFYKRPIVSIVEQLSPIYAFDATGSKVASLVTQSFANIKVSQLDTFAGDVKRVKVYRTSQGDISDYDLIQDILVESKELLTTTTLSGSVVGEAGLFTSETLQKLWNTGSLNTALTSSKIDNGLSLKGSGYLRYTSSLNLTNGNTYELGIDAFYSSSTASNMGIYVSGSQNGAKLIGTLNGIVPTKNLTDQVFAFTLDKTESTASLYLSQSQSEWHVGNISLKASEDSAFSPSEISFVTSMPTVLGNETYNFKFEFYDVNNNYVPVAVTQSALFSGGNNNIGGTLILISGSTSASNASILALSQSVSGTIGIVTGSISQSFVTSSAFSASLQSSSLFISSSISGTISLLSSSISGTISSLSASQYSASNFQFSYSAFLDSRIFTNTNGKINRPPTASASGLYTGETYLGFYSGSEWRTYMDNQGDFYLTSSAAGGGFLAWDSSTKELNIAGSITILGGDAATKIFANTAASASSSAAATSVSTSLSPNIFTDSTGKVVKPPVNTASNYGLYLGSSNLGFYSASVWRTYMDNVGNFYLTGSASNYLKWDGGVLNIAGAINITSGQAATDIANAASSGSSALTYAIANNTTASIATTNLSIFTNAAGLVNRTATPVGSGLYMDSTHLGYYKSGAGWATFMSSSGLFYLSGSAGNSLLWDGNSLTINGAGNFSGNISAATGTFTGGVSGTGYTLNNSGLNLTNASSTISLGNGVTLNNSGLSGSGFSLTTAGITATAGTVGSWKIGATTLESTNNKTILDATNNSITTKDTTTGDIRVNISNDTTLPLPSTLVNVYDSNISSANYSYANTTAGDSGTVNTYVDGPNFTVAAGGVYNLSFGIGHSFAGSYIFATGNSSITAGYYLQLYNVTTNTVVFEDANVIGAGTANGSSYDYGGGDSGNNTGYATPNPTGMGSGINSVTLTTGHTYRTRIRFYQNYYIDFSTAYYPLPDVGYTIPGYYASVSVYTSNTRTTINAAGFQALIDGNKYLEVKNGTELFDATNSSPSKYSTNIKGDIKLDGVMIKHYPGIGFYKYYPSVAAQCIAYSISSAPAYVVMNGAYPFYFQGDGIAAITRNSVGVFTITLKRNVYNSMPNVVVSGTGEQYSSAYTSTKYSVTFIDNKSFRIRCVSSNSLTMVDPYTINIAVFSIWDAGNKYD